MCRRWAGGRHGAQSVTERANELADDLDRCTEKSFVRLMHSVDGQVFSGYRQYPSIYDEDILGLMEQVGLSGRLAFAPLQCASPVPTTRAVFVGLLPAAKSCALAAFAVCHARMPL
jgi:hypothetical protein